MKQELIIIKTNEDFRLLSEYIKDFEYIAFDTETTGVAKNSQIIGFSICAEYSVGFYVILHSWDVTQQKLIELETCEIAGKFLSSLLTKKLVMHNATFDCARVNDIYKIDLMSAVHTDTMILAHIVDENRRVALKELGVSIFGEKDTKKEKNEMEASIVENGGKCTRNHYELYKADAELIAKYGAKDAILTFNIFNHLVPQLFEQGLDKFFYDEESMPLLKGPTYQLNTSGLKVDEKKLQQLRGELEASIMASQAFIDREIKRYVKDRFPGTAKSNTFNIDSNQQLAWLLFERLGENFTKLTDSGKLIQKELGIKTTYTMRGQIEFRDAVKTHKGQLTRTGQTIGDFWKYICCDADSLENYTKYDWVKALLKQKKDQKILSTYVIGIQEKVQFGIIRPSFDQKGTTSGRYSSRDPNFQNLPRDDKRVKSCIIARPDMVFVGADYSQLEPRVFASVSQDPTLLECFRKGEDFYSVVGSKIFGIFDCSLFKDDKGSFAEKHKDLRQIAKAFALATPYGTGAYRQASALKKKVEECQEIINRYFEAYPKVELMMLESHEQAKANGVVYNLYGRPRRMPEAKSISKTYGKSTPHGELPYEARNILNLAMNHRVQSSAASIVNRASIEFCEFIRLAGWDARLVLQVHDQLVVECKKEIAEYVAEVLQHCMEYTTKLPGVDLIAKPFITNNLAEQS